MLLLATKGPKMLGAAPPISALGPAVCIDFETHLIRIDEEAEVAHMLAPRPVCLAWYDGTRSGLIPCWLPEARSFLRALLESDRILIGHSIAFDFLVAAAEWPELLPLIFAAYDAGRIRCTKVKQLLIDIARGEHKGRVTRGRFVRGTKKAGLHALATLVDHWLDERMEKENTFRLRYGELDGVDMIAWPEEAIDYPLGDASGAYRVIVQQGAFVQNAGYSDDGIMPDELRQTRADFALHLLQSWGIRTDPTRVAELRTRIGGEVETVLESLIPSGMVSRERGALKRNMQAIRDRVTASCARRGVAVPLTDGGAVATDTDTLKECSDDEALVALGNVSHSMTILSREIPQLERGTRWPLCARYNVLVESGRTSTSKPNIQNPSRKGGVRECYVARRGFMFADVDYEAIELHALAQACLDIVGHSALADALNKGLDPHLLFAAQLLGISYDEAKARRREKVVKDMRQLAKVANFGFPGGLAAKTFVEYAHGYDDKLKSIVDLPMAERLHDAWFKAWPEMREYFARVGSMIGVVGVVRQLRSKRIRGGVEFCAAANTFFQGLTADGCKDAMWLLAKECYLGEWTVPACGADEEVRRAQGAPSPLLGSRIVIFMHDEFIVEVPSGRWDAHRAAHRLAAVMRAAMQAWMPDVRVKADPALMWRWWKGVEPVKDTDGCLLPSMPGKKTNADVVVEEIWVYDEGPVAEEARRFLERVERKEAKPEDLFSLPEDVQVWVDRLVA